MSVDTECVPLEIILNSDPINNDSNDGELEHYEKKQQSSEK